MYNMFVMLFPSETTPSKLKRLLDHGGIPTWESNPATFDLLVQCSRLTSEISHTQTDLTS
jgi:hypothetical protein